MNRRPQIGVGAVVFNERGEILLIKRGKRPHYGRWMVPGGSLEWGERLEEAAIREVREETGIEIVIDAFVATIEAITPGDEGFHYVIMDYAGRAIGGTLQASSDALDAIWISVKRAREECDLTPDLNLVIEKALRVTGRASVHDQG